MPHSVPLTREQLEGRDAMDAAIREHLAFVRQVANMLEEDDKAFYQIHLVTRIVGTAAVIALLRETLAIELAEGMLTADGKRRRTAGGVFFILAKRSSEEVRIRCARAGKQNKKKEDPEVKDK
jgi:hypothetical protein